MHGGGEVRNGLIAVPPGGSLPRPAVVWALDVYLLPEPFHLPVPVHVELGYVHGAAALFQLLHAVEALSHQAEVPFVGLAFFLVPGAGQSLSHVIRNVEFPGGIRIFFTDLNAVLRCLEPQGL